jgi:hypothetical protein
MGFKPLEELEGPIELTLRGKTYTLPTIMWDHGVRLQQRISEGMTMLELQAELLGPVLDQLKADGATAALIDRVANVAYADWRLGRDAAEQAWADPKALTRALAEAAKAIQALTAPPTPTGTGEDTTTPQPGSPSTTRSPKKAARSRGKKSSPTGPSS